MRGQPDLSRGRPAVVGDRTGFAPDEFGPAVAEPLVAAKRQFAGRAVGVAVAPFHWVNAPAVADGSGTDPHGVEQNVEILRESQVDPEPGVLRFEVRNGLVLEV